MLEPNSTNIFLFDIQMNVWNKYIVLPSFLKSHFFTLIDCDGFQEEEDELDHELLCNDVNLDDDEYDDDIISDNEETIDE